MAEETQTLEQPPVGKTSIGDKYRETLSQLQKPTTEKAAPEQKETTPEKKSESKPASALDAAIDERKPADEKKTEPKWEDAEVLKEFDPKQANWQNARKKIGTQELEIKRLTSEIESARKAGTQVDPKTVADLMKRDENGVYAGSRRSE